MSQASPGYGEVTFGHRETALLQLDSDLNLTLTLHCSLTAGTVTGNYQDPHQSAQNKGIQREPDFICGSGPIFSMYMEMVSEEDKKMAE